MIRVGICGYGNLGRACEKVISINSKYKLVGIFTKRNPSDIKTLTNARVYNVNEVESFKDKIDVMLMCGGSLKDLPIQSVEFNKLFNIIDSFDTHKLIINHYNNLDETSKLYKKVSLISTGWDPGLLSVHRLYNDLILLNGLTYTFWGKGVSQGHSDAIRKIEGVLDAISYTLPITKVLDKVKEQQVLKKDEHMHTRLCYVVVKDDASKEIIEKTIKDMPHYFKDYDTSVIFVSKEILDNDHKKIYHAGNVISFNEIDDENNTLEFNLKTESNPIMTALIITSYIHSVYTLSKNKEYGCKTVFDIPLSLMSDKTKEELLNNYL